MPRMIEDRIALKEERAETVKRFLKRIPSKVEPLRILVFGDLTVDIEAPIIAPVSVYLPEVVAAMAKEANYRIASYREPQSSKDCPVVTTTVYKMDIEKGE